MKWLWRGLGPNVNFYHCAYPDAYVFFPPIVFGFKIPSIFYSAKYVLLHQVWIEYVNFKMGPRTLQPTKLLALGFPFKMMSCPIVVFQASKLGLSLAAPNYFSLLHPSGLLNQITGSTICIAVWYCLQFARDGPMSIGRVCNHSTAPWFSHVWYRQDFTEGTIQSNELLW